MNDPQDSAIVIPVEGGELANKLVSALLQAMGEWAPTVTDGPTGPNGETTMVITLSRDQAWLLAALITFLLLANKIPAKDWPEWIPEQVRDIIKKAPTKGLLAFHVLGSMIVEKDPPKGSDFSPEALANARKDVAKWKRKYGSFDPLDPTPPEPPPDSSPEDNKL